MYSVWENNVVYIKLYQNFFSRIQMLIINFCGFNKQNIHIRYRIVYESIR